uniref:Arrestin C-terminal-like domain-containing protein n=1 Tax=Plectus sambesii TaxID=2011161 RepID=A0A914X579_9BILA
MVKPDIFDIFFDDHHRVYQPGQNVSGCVELLLSKEIKARGVFLTIYGGADTHWTEQETHAHHSHGRHSRSGSRSVTVHYRSREVYIDSSVMLWGNGNAQMIPPGRYSLPFSVCLPHLCLPSFQGNMGKIQYYCQAKIDRPWRFDHKVKEMFTVLTIYDLNLSPMTAVGVSAEDSKSLGCCCCVDGTVYFQANIPKTGFVPGECIKVNLHLDNRSNRPMHSFEIYLLQVVSYTAARE